MVINTHILHTVLYTFPNELTRRICSLMCDSGWYCKEKFHIVSHITYHTASRTPFVIPFFKPSCKFRGTFTSSPRGTFTRSCFNRPTRNSCCSSRLWLSGRLLSNATSRLFCSHTIALRRNVTHSRQPMSNGERTSTIVTSVKQLIPLFPSKYWEKLNRQKKQKTKHQQWEVSCLKKKTWRELRVPSHAIKSKRFSRRNKVS